MSGMRTRKEGSTTSHAKRTRRLAQARLSAAKANPSVRHSMSIGRCSSTNLRQLIVYENGFPLSRE
jgi:hypothetical protein